MPVPAHRQREIRFAEFRLDTVSGELFCNGRSSILQEKPLQILIALLEKPGQLLPREELRRRLWDSDTFVDFDQSLNKAVNRLREALRDSADKPRYIETLPRRGYRYIGSVEVAPTLPFLREHSSTLTPAVPEVPSPIPVPAAGQDAGRRRGNEKLLWLAGTCILLLVASIAVVWFRPAPQLSVLTKVTQLTNDGRIKHGPLLANGGILYYNRRVDETWEIAQLSAASGISVAVPGSRDFCLADMAADGSELLVAPCREQETPIYALALPASAPRRLADIVATDASWSPDRTRLAYSSGTDIFLANYDGTQAHKLTTAPGPVSPIGWSQDGKRLRFTVSDIPADRLSIWEVGTNGTKLQQMYPDFRPQAGEWGLCCGQWTPDNSYYIFQSDRDGGGNLWAASEIVRPFRINHPQRLTSGPHRIVASVPSRDGKTIYAIGLVQRGELLRYDSRSQRFTPHFAGLSAVQLSFSPNARWMAYITFPDRLLWRCRSDATECLQLTFPPMVASWPQWSPDGTQIAFSGQVRGEPFHIFRMSSRGGELQQLTTGERDQLHPSWSADGAQIVYSTNADLHGDTTGLHRLLLSTHEDSVLPGSDQKHSFPRYSPDGNFIAALHGQNLTVFDVRARRWTTLGSLPASQLAWSADSRSVYFVSSDGQQAGVYRIRIAQNKAERVAVLDSIGRQSWGKLAWMGFTPDGSLLVFHDLSTSEIYSFAWNPP